MVASLVLLALAGCASEPQPTLTSTQAASRLDPLFGELRSALEDAYPAMPWELENDHVLVMQSDYCGYWIGRVGTANFSEEQKEDVLKLMAPLLEEAGFPELDYIEPSDGVPYRPAYLSELDSARVRVSFENPGLGVSVFSDVTDQPCED